MKKLIYLMLFAVALTATSLRAIEKQKQDSSTILTEVLSEASKPPFPISKELIFTALQNGTELHCLADVLQEAKNNPKFNKEGILNTLQDGGGFHCLSDVLHEAQQNPERIDKELILAALASALYMLGKGEHGLLQLPAIKMEIPIVYGPKTFQWYWMFSYTRENEENLEVVLSTAVSPDSKWTKILCSTKKECRDFLQKEFKKANGAIEEASN